MKLQSTLMMPVLTFNYIIKLHKTLKVLILQALVKQVNYVILKCTVPCNWKKEKKTLNLRNNHLTTLKSVECRCNFWCEATLTTQILFKSHK